MTTWICLIRGINVGGHQILPMAVLRSDLARAGLTEVRTYIQSGNIVFRSAAGTAKTLGARISRIIAEGHGFTPRVLVLRDRDLIAAAAANPFPEAQATPKSLHLFFLASEPERADLDALNRLKIEGEAFALHGKVFYLRTPVGFGVSKLGERAERHLGVDATARNWNTVSKLIEMAREGA